MLDTTKQNFILYSDANGDVLVQILADTDNETIWLNQKQISEIFGVDRSVITKHIQNIYKDDELDEATTSANFAQVRSDSTSIGVKHYNLDMIIAVGYRVNSYKATKFRQWATKTLKEFIIKGFVLDDERLKQGGNIFNKDYFNELIERIRAIRASEKRFYEKLRELFALSVDYDKNSQQARDFFANAQNKLEYAITGLTSAEIIFKRADSKKPNLGLTNWSKKTGVTPIKTDIKTAKNYLSEPELKNLNTLTTMLLDYAENLAQRGIVMQISDWGQKLDEFLKFNSYEVLDSFGAISRKQAITKAENEWQKFKELEKISKKENNE